MERFQQLLENRHTYAKEWKKKTGGKVMGYLCTYFPEELAYAAGVLPVRIISEPEVDDVTERYIYGAFCPLSRDILAAGLKGKYDYLDGIAYAEGCMHLRHIFGDWRLHISTPYNYYVSVPSHVEGPRAARMLHGELTAFKKDIEAWSGNTVSEESLRRAVEIYNTNRTMMRQIYQMRRVDRPPVSGTQVFEMVLSSQIMDKEEHNWLLTKAIGDLSERKTDGYAGIRLMLLGSDITDTRLVRMIESMGAVFVIDELCSGSSYVWNDVVLQNDLLFAIALRYLDKPRCPLKDVKYRRRVAHVSQLIEDYNVGGAIIALQKFCHPQQFDLPEVRKALEKRNIPMHIIEHDGTIPVAEYRTRIQAFLDIFHTALA
jgi:benzoyl-CoA reductase subunit C